MRLLFFAYFVIEVLAFIVVARLIGLGWAFLAVFALSVLGGVGANIALRNSLTRAAGGRNSLGRFAGDSAILAAGWILCILPGFVSSLVGLALIFPPTRALVRRSLTAKATKAVEDFSMRVYAASPVSRRDEATREMRRLVGPLFGSSALRWLACRWAGIEKPSR